MKFYFFDRACSICEKAHEVFMPLWLNRTMAVSQSGHSDMLLHIRGVPYSGPEVQITRTNHSIQNTLKFKTTEKAQE